MSDCLSDVSRSSAEQQDSSAKLSVSSTRRPRSHSKDKKHSEACSASQSSYVLVRTPADKSKKGTKDAELYFIGSMTTNEVERVVLRGDFRLYYKLPRIDRCELPVELKLYVVYHSTSGKIFHYPVITVSEPNEGRRFQVLYGDPRSLSFSTISDLVAHYRTYSYWCEKRNVFETFPVWQNDLVPEEPRCDSIYQ
ncbi:hypothetical protein QR680_003594 [Steinernema hermaphroditum]|uniref:SH2 domain-containing protein n=1 Tax=Steinernema hermaphroditum TaxID=289476 RepID=A0AA39HKW4_9BILA|nr:hypothetical protein QR680_003594 [Steinernema hermaphroditum]